MAIVPELKMPFLANKFGGLSGPAIRPIGVRGVYDICEKVHIPVVGVGGVGSGREALEYIMAGGGAPPTAAALLPERLPRSARRARKRGRPARERAVRA